MSALPNPVDCTKGGAKWLLVTHTLAMFSFVTTFTAINLDFNPFPTSITEDSLVITMGYHLGLLGTSSSSGSRQSPKLPISPSF
jgi:hypothetical protein